ncbi:MAG: preprotein translocase subunit SecE [Mycoplasma sp.]|nr:preprotein translocase subunit SecE [Mycoplasma sp.]
MKNSIKRFLKEFKRMKWPTTKEFFFFFSLSLVFLIITSLFFYGVSLLFTHLWDSIGVSL